MASPAAEFCIGMDLLEAIRGYHRVSCACRRPSTKAEALTALGDSVPVQIVRGLG